MPLEKILNLVAAGAADADLVSTLAARLARLDRELDDDERQSLTQTSGGQDLATLNAELLRSIDPDEVAADAQTKFQLPPDQPPSEQQLDQAEQDRMRQALKPFHNPKLRDAVLNFKRSHEQVIDEQTPDKLLRAGFDTASKEKAQSLLTNFRKFLDDHKDEIEALQILYSRPHRAGLRYSQVKELAKAIQSAAADRTHFTLERLWQAYETVEPDKVQGHGGKQLVDVVALVRHALDPNSLLAPIGLTVEERYQQWLADQAAAGATFTPEQRRWIDAIKDHIATSLAIERDDLDEVPFNQFDGLGKAFELFGDRLAILLDELNQRLAA